MCMIRRHGEWLTAETGDSLMMLSIERGNYVGMNAVGARIWELIETPLSLDALCDHLLTEFDVDEGVCRSEIGAFLDKLEQNGLASLDRS